MSKSNKGRVLTIRFEIQTDEYPEWLHKGMLTQQEVNGVIISALAEGDMFKELDDAVEVIKETDSDAADEFREKYHY